MYENHIKSFKDIFKTVQFYWFVGIFGFIFLLFSFLFINLDAFEGVYEYSRSHESWELDEWILIFISFFISLSISLFIMSIFLIRKIIRMTQEEIAHEKRLHQNQKLQAMGTLLGGLAHSLNNHLLPIITISKIIKEETDKDSLVYEDISKVLQAAQGTDAILKQVLNFAREDNTDLLESCIIDETLNKALDLIQSSVPSNIYLERDIPNINQIVPISRVNLEIIIFNLVTNSIDALEHKKEAKISVKLRSDEIKEQVLLEVKDNGKGMNQKEIRKIFDPFFTSKPQGKGTGLGLSETYGIINNINGEIFVDSKEDEFTKFTINLPIKKEV